MIDFSSLWGGVDWAILVVYFIAVLGVGFLMHKRASTSFKSFFVASRRLTIPVLIGVAMAGWYDSWTIVGLAECGWTMGISIIFICSTNRYHAFTFGLMDWPHNKDKT